VNLTHKNIYLSFASATKVRVLCYLLCSICDRESVTTKFYLALHVMMVVNARCWVF